MIISKDVYCRNELKKYLKRFYNCKIEDTEWLKDIPKIATSSTTIGICLQQLRYITPVNFPDAYDYISNRGGTFEIWLDKDAPQIMSFREFLSLLPDE